MTSYKEIFKAISLFGSVQGITTLLNLLRTKLIAVLVGTVGTGLNSIYFESRELIHISTNLGLDTSGIRIISLVFEEWKNATTDEARAKAWQRLKEEVRLVRSLALMLATLGVVAMAALSLLMSYMSFQDSDHIVDFLLLAPTVGLTTIVCSEMAILKSMRKLKSLALISVLNVVMSILTSVPIYYFFGIKGIIAAIVVFLVVEYLTVVTFSYRLIRPQFEFSTGIVKKGMPILKLGVALTMAGVALRLSNLGIRSYINSEGGTDMVGLYSAGYTIVMILGGFVFSSMDSDFYPRLSGAFDNMMERRIIVYKQIKAIMVIIVPVVALFVVLLPWLVPLLLSHDFDPVVPMAQVASVGLIFRAATQPYGYVPIAAGNSRLHMILEAYCDFLTMFAVMFGFSQYGLVGAGLAYTIANAIDVVVLWVVMRWKYGI